MRQVRNWGLDKDRLYRSYQEMAVKEAQRENGIDFVSIVTPNFLHYDIAKEFLLHDIHVVCDKPLTIELEEAEELSRIAKERNLLFCVTYNYTGYPMVKKARDIIKKGEIGEIKIVIAEFPSDWLAKAIVSNDNSIGLWRTDPKQSGKSNCVGDVGSHMENLVSFITGLGIDELLAKMDAIGDGMVLDTNGQIMVKYTNGATGSYWCSQVAIGSNNALNIRVFGTKGSIEWHQNYPDYLKVAMINQPVQMYSREECVC